MRGCYPKRALLGRGQNSKHNEKLPPLESIPFELIPPIASAILNTYVEDCEWMERRLETGKKPKKIFASDCGEPTRMSDAIDAIRAVVQNNPMLDHWCHCAGGNVRTFKRYILQNYPLTVKWAMGV